MVSPSHSTINRSRCSTTPTLPCRALKHVKGDWLVVIEGKYPTNMSLGFLPLLCWVGTLKAQMYSVDGMPCRVGKTARSVVVYRPAASPARRCDSSDVINIKAAAGFGEVCLGVMEQQAIGRLGLGSAWTWLVVPQNSMSALVWRRCMHAWPERRKLERNFRASRRLGQHLRRPKLYHLYKI